jgi:hypothetical protein
MDIEEYQRLKDKAQELLAEADKHLMEDTLLLGIGLAVEGQAYATLALAEASRPVPSRRAVSVAPVALPNPSSTRDWGGVIVAESREDPVS